MKRILTLSVLPVIGLALISFAVWWNRAELRLRIIGEKAPGHVAGMLMVRTDKVDLIHRIDTHLSLTLGSGEKIEVACIDFNETASSRERNKESPEVERVITDAIRGDATTLRWALQREARREKDPRRVVRIEKTEQAAGYLDMPALPAMVIVDKGKVIPDVNAAPGVVSIRAVFDQSNPTQVKRNKGDSMLEYRQTRNGDEFAPAKKDFILFCEPYTTEFRPVFRHESEGRSLAGISHIGRRGGPTLAIRLFGSCWVFRDPMNPESAVLIADPGKPDGAWLAWFSRLCEGTFSQWGAGALIVFVGGACILIGLLAITLVLKPSKGLVSD